MDKPKEFFDDINLVIRLNQHLEQITSDKAATASLFVRQSSFNVLTELSAIRSNEQREEAQFDHQKRAFLQVANSNCPLPFHLQGDEEFNKASMVAKRQALKSSQLIQERIAILWQVAQQNKQQQDHTASSPNPNGGDEAPTAPLIPYRSSISSMRLSTAEGVCLPDFTDTNTTINEDLYSCMMLLVYKVLRDDFVMEKAQQQIRCDWEVDSERRSMMRYREFFNAMFEVVDVWTCDVLEATYVRFLELLTKRITLRVIVFLDDNQLKLAVSDNIDDPHVVRAIPLRTIKYFCSFAKIAEISGATTVGDLADADPTVIEGTRAQYVDDNNFSKVKLGSDLRHLLAMLRNLPPPYVNNTRVTVKDPNNMPLQEIVDAEAPPESLSQAQLSRAAKPRSGAPKMFFGRMPVINEGLNGGNKALTSNAAINEGLGGGYKVLTSNDAINEELGGSNEAVTSNVAINEGLSGGANEAVTSNVAISEGLRSGIEVVTRNALHSRSASMSLAMPPTATAHFDVSGGRARSGSNFSGSWRAANALSTPEQQNALEPPVNEFDLELPPGMTEADLERELSGLSPQEQEEYIRRKGLRRWNSLNSFRDTDSGMINAFRSTFLIEKGISIQKKTSMRDILEELVKFGVDDAPKMDETTARERYDSLYEMLVLHDGESLKGLASTMLQQIKYELALHGIDIEDEDQMELAYDGFYDQVVVGNGAEMVQEAKDWVTNTVRDKSARSFIKDEYTGFRKVEDVALLGTQPGDEEFVSLVVQENEPGALKKSLSMHKENNVKAIPVSQETKPSSPTTTKNEPLEPIRPSPLPSGAATPPNRPEPTPSATTTTTTITTTTPTTPTPVAAPTTTTVITTEAAPAPKSEEVKSSPRTKRKAGKTKHEGTSEAAQVKSDTPTKKEPKSNVPKVRPIKTIDNPALFSGTKCKTRVTETPKDSLAVKDSDREIVKNNVVVSKEEELVAPELVSVDEKTSSAVNTRSRLELDPVIPLSTSRKQPTNDIQRELTVQPPAARPLTNDSDESQLQHLNVAFGYEEEVTDVVLPLPTGPSSISVTQEPKIPFVVISGVDTSSIISMATRYIELLNVGKVVSFKEQTECFEFLRTPTAQCQVDIVCFDIGKRLDEALSITLELQELVGKRVILFGGDPDNRVKTDIVAAQCVANGVHYFGKLPLDFAQLRFEILKYFEKSSQVFVLRTRKNPLMMPVAPLTNSIGDVGTNFVGFLPESRTMSITTSAYANVAKPKLVLPALLPRESVRGLNPRSPSSTAFLDENDDMMTPLVPAEPPSPRLGARSSRRLIMRSWQDKK